MVKDFVLSEDYIQFADGFGSWEEAVIQSAQPLLKGGEVEQTYIDAMIDSVNENGPYIVIAPNIALPHARPETGSKKTGFSVMVTKEPVTFAEGNQAKLFIALSCVDADTHLEMLQKIVMILSDQGKQDVLMNATSSKEILRIFA